VTRTMERQRVVCIGIATLDAIVVVDRLPRTDERMPGRDSALAGGGVAATAAVTLARLGIPVSLIGRVGDDRAGRWIRDDLASEGVDVRALRLLSDTRSPLSAVLVEQSGGARAIAPDLGDAGPIALDPDEIDLCREAAWVHVDLRGAPAIAQLERAGVDTLVSLDDGIPDADIPSLSSIALYAPTAAALLARRPALDLEAAIAEALDEGPDLVVVTRGRAGAMALERDPSTGVAARLRAVAPAVDVLSTLGAGDVFHGALLAGLVEGRSAAEALHRATVCAALACRGLDGRSAIPSPAELDRAVADHQDTTTTTGGMPDARV